MAMARFWKWPWGVLLCVSEVYSQWGSAPPHASHMLVLHTKSLWDANSRGQMLKTLSRVTTKTVRTYRERHLQSFHHIYNADTPHTCSVLNRNLHYCGNGLIDWLIRRTAKKKGCSLTGCVSSARFSNRTDVSIKPSTQLCVIKPQQDVQWSICRLYKN